MHRNALRSHLAKRKLEKFSISILKRKENTLYIVSVSKKPNDFRLKYVWLNVPDYLYFVAFTQQKAYTLGKKKR